MTTRSISSTLTRMNLMVSAGVLILACAMFGAYDLAAFRAAMLRNLSVSAQIVGANTVSALVFEDADTATDTLAALAAVPEVLAAEIYTADGGSFARFNRPAVTGGIELPAIPPGADEVRHATLTTVILARPIAFEGAKVGSVALQADLTPMYARLGRYLLIAAVVLAACLAATFGISRVAQRAVARPIIHLADLTHRVSEANDYSVRAPMDGTVRELVYLNEGFNDMLDAIQARERRLEDAKHLLEARVQERTQELQAINQELESFSYSVSHDLRAPVRHIAGFANLLEQHAAGTLDDRSRRYIKTILESASKMGRLIDDLLAFSRMGRAAVSKQPVNLRTLVEDVRVEVELDAGGRRVQWEIGSLPVVHADPALLRAAIVNLLSNGVKYTGTRDVARIQVGTETAQDGQVVVYVRDNGVGFDMQYVHKLFGVFQRLHSSGEFAGTGIGLASVRRIIQRHGGRTWAVGKTGEGATFYFSLPAAA